MNWQSAVQRSVDADLDRLLKIVPDLSADEIFSMVTFVLKHMVHDFIISDCILPQTLERLFKVADVNLISSIASSPCATNEVLESCFDILKRKELTGVSSNSYVNALKSLAAAKAASEGLLRKIFNFCLYEKFRDRIKPHSDFCGVVRAIVWERENLCPDFIRDILDQIKPHFRECFSCEDTALSLAKCRSATADILAVLAGANVNVREAVALHSKTSPDTLRKLAGDPSITVRVTVAGNGNLPEDAIRKLYSAALKYKYDFYREPILNGLLANPNLPEDVLLAMSLLNIPSVSRTAQWRLAKKSVLRERRKSNAEEASGGAPESYQR